MIKQSADPAKLVEYQHAPVSLFPTPYPYHVYEQAYNYQAPLGMLVSSLAAKPKKIHSLLESFLKYDPFLERLVGVSKAFNEFALSENAEERKKVQTI